VSPVEPGQARQAVVPVALGARDGVTARTGDAGEAAAVARAVARPAERRAYRGCAAADRDPALDRCTPGLVGLARRRSDR
jgi:hypothetical protein